MDEKYEKLELELVNQLKSAYKKYKNSIYYDNYSSIQRVKLANFEIQNLLNDDDSFFEKIAKQILDSKGFDLLLNQIYDEINVIAFPKQMKTNEIINQNVIRNYNIRTNEIDRLYYFIDLPILGHVFGVLWILRCGYILDDKLYENCYGNRLNESLLSNLKNKKSNYYQNNKFDLTHSLFKPYYKNYESWRDNGLNNVDNILKTKKHAVMISMDLKEYYYRSLIDFKELKKDLMDTHKKNNQRYNFHEEIEDLRINKILTNFIEEVFKIYSSKFERKFNINSFRNEMISLKEYPMIPLGFLPSLIISNWYLQGFDQTIVENVQPQYYGRYVDDILIVLGIHEKSESHGLQQIDELNNSQFIKKYLTPIGYPKIKLFDLIEDNVESCYKIHNQCFKNIKGNEINYIYDALEINEKKFRTYYFSHNYSDAMIQNFKEEIRKNSSEFRLMHDLSSIKVDFRENLYKIKYRDSINKIHDIEDIDINKFEISKILSRINWVSSDTSDKIDDELIVFLIGAFKGKLFEFISLWEKIFSMLLINNKYDDLSELIQYIQNSILKLKIAHNYSSNNFYIRNHDIIIVKKSLEKFLKSCLIRVFSLKNNNDTVKIIHECYGKKFNDIISIFLQASMQNNSLMKYPIRDVNLVAENLSNDENFSFNLINGNYDYMGMYNGEYYPRFVKLHECILDSVDREITSGNDFSGDIELFYNGKTKKVTPIYPRIKYGLSSKLDDYFINAFEDYEKINFGSTSDIFPYIKSECGLSCKEDYCPIEKFNHLKNLRVIKTPGNIKQSLKVGLLNSKLDFSNFERRLLDKPNLSSNRFDKIKLLINEAIEKNVELLIMPEMYIPYEWIEKIVKISKDHQMAIIFGVEPIVNNDEVGNYIMTALPFVLHDKYHECALVYRLKNYYAPNEIKQIKENGKVIKTVKNNNEKYYMYIWNGIHIVPYYCYELSSVEDRAIFKSCCDIVTVSEFNKDTIYFDNIAESLSRDLFCYCLKSNTSEFGGSCIIQPTSSNKNYLVKLKGGNDDYIVTQELDIAKLRNSATKIDGHDVSYFKPKPAGFSQDVVKKRFI